MSRAPDLVWEHQAASLIDAYDNVARRDGLKPRRPDPRSYRGGVPTGAMLADGARSPAVS